MTAPNILAIDLSVRHLGLVAGPADWMATGTPNWGALEHTTLHTDVDEKDRALLNASLADRVVRWTLERFAAPKGPPWVDVWIESYPQGRAFNIPTLCELGGVVRDRLRTRLGLTANTAQLTSARVLLLGGLPRSGHKEATHRVVDMAPHPLKTPDEKDAWVVFNYACSQLGYPAVASPRVTPARKRSPRRRRTA